MVTDTVRLLYIPAIDDRARLESHVSDVLDGDLGPTVGVLLRAYDWQPREQLTWLRRWKSLASESRVFVSGRTDLAIAAGIDGVHLAAHAVTASDARRLLEERGSVGVSCHDAAELVRAHGADYVTLSPVHHVEDKRPPLGVEGFCALARQSPCPVLALGGVTLDDVAALVRGGAHGVAIRRAIDEAQSPTRVIRDFLRAIDDALPR